VLDLDARSSSAPRTHAAGVEHTSGARPATTRMLTLQGTAPAKRRTARATAPTDTRRLSRGSPRQAHLELPRERQGQDRGLLDPRAVITPIAVAN
jgi:hypothetical protein